MISEYTLNVIAQYAVYGLLRAGMLASADIESAISDLEHTLKDLFLFSADVPAISPVENRRGLALAMVGKLVAMRRLDAYRRLERSKWMDKVLQAVCIVEVELLNAQDQLER